MPDLVLNKAKCLDLFESWNAHSIYYPSAIAKDLTDCGVEVVLLGGQAGIMIGGVEVPVIEPEWGALGIAPEQVVAALALLTVGAVPETGMTGRGFRYRRLCELVSEAWGEHRTFL